MNAHGSRSKSINKVFGTDIDKDVVRRILAAHYRPDPGNGGPSWLTFIGNTKDSLWSVDLFRCEPILLKSHWILVVMDQFTRRIVGFGVHAGDMDGVALFACSTLPFHPVAPRNISALITIRYSCIANGMQT